MPCHITKNDSKNKDQSQHFTRQIRWQYRGDTELILLGLDAYIPYNDKDWLELWHTGTHLYKLTPYIDNICKKKRTRSTYFT